MKMKKAKLFMMLALLVMGVSNTMGATKTKDYFVNYETEFLTGTGYNIDASKSNLTKVSHLPFYRLSRIIKHCNILIDNLLTFRK